jgi:hypothetical protein
MAASPNPSPNPESKSLATVLVPVAGVALLIIVMIVIGSTNDSSTGTDKSGKDGQKNELVSGPGKPMSDGSDGGTDDPNLKPIGTEGLKYRDLREGTGEECPKGASVEVNYSGWLANGHKFDSGHTTFGLSNVIPGWTQGIPGMKVGGIRKLVIPSDLGYGARGAGKDIPGGATLIFEVELINISR